MALMTEERRKEMEEEMSRFELEIAGPGESNVPSSRGDSAAKSKPLSPPPAPPAVATLIPEVLIKGPPPPPPPSLSPPAGATAALRPPPPPPTLQSRPAPPAPRFIPHQLHRQPPKPPVRPAYMSMPGPPGPFPPPGPFGPPMGQGPPMGPMPNIGPMAPGPQMHPVIQMPPGLPMGHMHGPMPPIPPGMHMHHQMGNMGMNLPMPPGFCPPPGPPMHLQGNEQQYFNMNDTPQNDEADVPTSDISASASEGASVLAAAPAIYAAPFVKSHADTILSSLASSNGQDSQVVTSIINTSFSQKTEKSISKAEEYTVGPTIPTSAANEETVVSSKRKEKKKKIVRMAGGQAWEDNSLLDWESDDFRIFCGDLGNDVTDEVLIRAFSKYPSFVKAKVIRDKRTNKTKGYGFVSFKDPQDFIKAMREMNGRYVGSRPIKLRKSTWRDRNIDLVKKKQKEKEKLGLL